LFRLALYVYEYLLHVGAQQAAQTFLSEIRWDKNITLGEPPGFLHCWWSVFWDLYCAAPERRESCDHSPEAKAFHDYNNSCNPPPTMPNMLGHISPGGPGTPTGPDGIPVTGGPHPMFFHPSFGPRGYGPRGPPGMRPMSQPMPGQAMMPSSMDPSRSQDILGPPPPGHHPGPMGMNPRMSGPRPMMSPQFPMRPQAMPPSGNPMQVNRMSPRPCFVNSRMSPGPNGPGTPGLMQPSPQPADGGPSDPFSGMSRPGGPHSNGSIGPASVGFPPGPGMPGSMPSDPIQQPPSQPPPNSGNMPPQSNDPPQPGDTMESAAILKIKESMQEEAKLFEKPDDSDYFG
jgi:hypothetical protein